MDSSGSTSKLRGNFFANKLRNSFSIAILLVSSSSMVIHVENMTEALDETTRSSRKGQRGFIKK